MDRPRRSILRKGLLGSAVLVLIVGICIAVDLSRIRPLQIGPRTTFVTPARRTDGTLDFVAALHERLSEGITEHENAAIPLIRAFGPSVVPSELRRQYFEWLKIDPLPEQGDYIVCERDFIRQIQAGDGPQLGPSADGLGKEFASLLDHAWTEANHPLAAEWIRRNEVPLKFVTEASRCPQYYSPLVSNAELFMGENNAINLRNIARLLTVRATMRLGQDDIAGAWDDLFTCHRLSGLISLRAPGAVHLLVCIAMDATASAGDAALIAHPMFAEQAKKCLSDHQQLAPIARAHQIIGLGERVSSLDAFLRRVPQTGVDQNLVLQRINVTFDDVIAALTHGDFKKRKEALNSITTELSARAAVINQPLRWIPQLMLTPRVKLSDMTATNLEILFIPALAQVNEAEARADTRRDLVRIGFALASFRAEEGDYPKALDELAGFLDAVPLDQYTGDQYRYLPRENGFLIYSVGSNGKDDGGILRSPDLDDIAFEVPPKTEE